VKDAMDEQRFRKEDGLCDVKVNIHHSPRETNKSQAESIPFALSLQAIFTWCYGYSPEVKMTIRSDKSHTHTYTLQ
jgi:hypothetical protein